MFVEFPQHKHYWVVFGVSGCGLIAIIAIGIAVASGWLTKSEPGLLQTSKIEGVIYDFALSPDGQLIVLSIDTERCWAYLMPCAPGEIQVRRVDTDTLIYAWEATDAQFSPDGRYLATSGAQGIDFWQLTGGTLAYTIGGEKYDTLALSPDGRMLAAGLLQARQIDLWDLASQNLIRQIRVDNGQINAIAFSPDSQSLAWGGERTVQILYIDDETTSRQLVGHTGGVEGGGFYEGSQLVDREVVNDIVFSPDGKLLAAGTGLALQGDCYSQWTVDHTVRIWRVDDGQRLHVFTEPQFGVEAVAFSPDGSLVAGVGGTHESYLGNTNPDWLWCSGE